MQDCTTILGIKEMRQRSIPYDACCGRYGVGNSSINVLIMLAFQATLP